MDKSKGEPKTFIVREMERPDVRRGFLETLCNLRPLNTELYELQEGIFDIRKSLNFTFKNKQIPVYYTTVAVIPSSEVIATATLMTELKHLHDGGLVGHIEDVARRAGEQYRGLGAGGACVKGLITFAKETGCYKAILDCSEKNASFYESLGFKRHEVGMRLSID